MPGFFISSAVPYTAQFGAASSPFHGLPYRSPERTVAEGAMSLTDSLGYAAAFLVLLIFSMKTMVPLRIVGIGSNLFFIAYAYLMSAPPILLLHLLLLPLNTLRLTQILTLSRKIEAAARGGSELDFEWLQTIGKSRTAEAGAILIRKGEKADRMFFVVSGTFVVKEIGVELGRGEIVGELGLLAPGELRTQTVECVSEADVLEVTYDRVKQLYFQSPKFGFYFLQLAARRLFENIERQNRELAAYRAVKTTIS
jgi:CRP/FNR family cyclic AMP-dependent transcriptional regulator